MLAGDAAHQTPPFAGQGMCSGLRDASNLSWKLAAVVKEGAPEALLDTYQTEREPNLRATIEMAIMMGRTVCITDPEAAKQRDAQMLAARKAGQSPDGNIAYPAIVEGAILKDTPGAGSYFPQAVGKGGERLDDVLGQSETIIKRDALANADLAPFANTLCAWFDEHNAEAVLVRPDRYVFGTGDVEQLSAAWERHAFKA